MANDLFDNWIYETNEDNSARFILGEKGENPLVCVGVNPSTAEPGNLDPTLTQVRNRSKSMGYDGWVMLNLYPQRATNPDDLHENFRLDYRTGNISNIWRAFLNIENISIWAAWGTLIEKRPYLKECLRDILNQVDNANWFTIGPLSQKGHPHHPLYLPKNSAINEFDVKSYIEGLKQ